MSLTLLVCYEMAKAFFPSRFEWLPNEPQLVKSPTTLLGQSFPMPPITDPVTEGKATLFVVYRDETMTLALLVCYEMAKAFLPSRFERVPNKPDRIKSLAPCSGH